jgi:hypothetical protein
MVIYLNFNLGLFGKKIILGTKLIKLLIELYKNFNLFFKHL